MKRARIFCLLAIALSASASRGDCGPWSKKRDNAAVRAQAAGQPRQVPLPADPARTSPPQPSRSGALDIGGEEPPSPLPEPFSARGGAIGVGAGVSGPVAERVRAKKSDEPIVTGPKDIVVEVSSAICCKQKVVVHCRGCPAGRCLKATGGLPACVKVQSRTFRVINPQNACPVDVVALLPDEPAKAIKIDKSPFYVTYHFEDCRITLWFLSERNNDYSVHYAPERS